MLTPSNEVLILIEHRHEVYHSELKKNYGNSLKGIIGKLEAQKLITRAVDKNGETFYELAPNGRAYIDSRLDNLHHKENAWDKRWTTVLFSIPEKNRPNRDRLRRYLQKLGFGNLYGSVWISPHNWVREIGTFTKQLGVAHQVIVLTSATYDSDNIIDLAWSVGSVKKRYEEFIAQTKNILPKIRAKGTDKGFEIKKIIFNLASIIATEPNLPPELLPTDWPKKKALALYSEARKKL